MRVLVTGASGFVGRAVLAQLRNQGLEAVAVSRHSRSAANSELGCVLTDPGDSVEVRRLLTTIEPQVIMHLAGTTSLDSYVELYRANVAFAANILDAAVLMPSRPRVLLVGSAAEYGPVASAHLPVNEDFRCCPNTAYGISKLAQTGHALAAKSRGLPVTVARLFNPIGAKMPTTLALGSFAQQIADSGSHGGVLRTGDLDVVRDFIDVDEAARLLIGLVLISKKTPEIVNVCTGHGQNLLALTRRLIELSGVGMEIQRDASRRGNSDIRCFVGDPAKLVELGLHPASLDVDLSLRKILTGSGL